MEEILPATAGSWSRTTTSALDASSAPELIRQLGLKRAASATYTGPATATIRFFEMNVQTSAFELIQKWRQKEDGLAVYSGPYFIVANPNSPPEASSLLEEVRKQLQQ